MDLEQRSRVSRLESNNEIIATLHAVEEGDICIKLIFSCIKEIELPHAALSIDKLQSLVGKKIGILNIDGQFFLRKI